MSATSGPNLSLDLPPQQVHNGAFVGFAVGAFIGRQLYYYTPLIKQTRVGPAACAILGGVLAIKPTMSLFASRGL